MAGSGLLRWLFANSKPSAPNRRLRFVIMGKHRIEVRFSHFFMKGV